jgi:hypothetical protein
MRRSRAPSNWPGPFFAARSWAGCTTIMFGFDLRQAQVKLVEDGEKVTPCERNVEAFIQWINERDLYQVPDTATDFLRDQEALNGDRAASGNDDLTLLPRKMVLQLRANANVSLGSGYRAYPGFSVAQVRKQLGLGW